ncbi:MAG: hypothetical protein K2P51_03175 [Rhabdochlamydiaceae bacterium]|nr:hypothetical protein [Rhabdochlamydiaceae bacterium]
MKFSHYLLACCVISASGVCADDPMTPMQPSTQSQPSQVQGPVDCSNLSKEEQLFASQMTDWNNRSVFCAKLNSEQRRAIMELSSKPNSSGVLMTPDQALLQYMQQNAMTPEGTPQPVSPKRRPSGCSGS